MNILVLADPLLPIPPVGYGGGERIIDLLCRGLHSRGHHVRLVAAAGSTTTAELVVHPRQSLEHRWCSFRRVVDLGSYGATLKRVLDGIDVVHSFKAIEHWWPLQAAVRQPLIYTFLNVISPSHAKWLLRVRCRSLRLCSISTAQRRHAPEGPWTTVYNATETDLFPCSETPRNPPYLLFLGRISPLKGTHIAIDVAQRCGMELIIAGNLSNEAGGLEYFHTMIEPKLSGRVRWVGEVNDSQKAALCREAFALLFPIQWEEPFGLVMTEALACGTPVIAFERGSVPEVIEHGKTGYIVNNADEMAAAVGRIGEISRRTCARVVRERFSDLAMVDKYIQVYEELLNRQTLKAIAA